MRKPGPFAVRVTTFIVCMVAFVVVIGPLACGDGWVSPSIGRLGACSWHGGVNYLPLYIAFLASLVAAFLSSNIVARFGKKSSSIDTVPQIFDVGAHVYHPRFGHGKVMQTEGDGFDAKLLISFGGRPKKLHLSTAISGGLRVTMH